MEAISARGKDCTTCAVTPVYLQVAPYQYVRRLEISMDNPIAAGGKGKIIEISLRDFCRTFQRKRQHILWLPMKIV
jgi:hypothetical protein